jgi:hypothetical protein
MAEHSDRRSPYDLEPRCTKLVSAMYLDDTSWGVAGRVVGENSAGLQRHARWHTMLKHTMWQGRSVASPAVSSTLHHRCISRWL